MSLTPWIQDPVATAQHDEPARRRVLSYKIAMTPDPREYIKVSFSILFHPIGTPKGNGHAEKRFCNDEFTTLACIVDVFPVGIPDLYI